MLAHLADQLRRAFTGGAWHGPAVLELLADIDCRQAAWVPQPGRHSIWVLVQHITAWLREVDRRVRGERRELADAENFPPVDDATAEAWEQAKEDVVQAWRGLAATIAQLTEADLARDPGGSDRSVHNLLDGAIQHSLYHAGQIAMLKRLHAADELGLLRHTLATLAYRAGKAVRNAPPEFAAFRVGPTSRTPAQILAHMGDLFDWAQSIARGAVKWRDSEPLPWPQEVERFFATLSAFDRLLATEPCQATFGRLFQGPIADALNHTGQLTMLRRLCGSPVRGESYYKADIAAGRTGPDQSPPRFEFGE